MVSFIIFICLIKPQLGADLASDSTAVRRANNQKYYQSYGTKFVQDVVKHLEDDETAKAMDLIATIDESAVPEEVKEFFKCDSAVALRSPAIALKYALSAMNLNGIPGKFALRNPIGKGSAKT